MVIPQPRKGMRLLLANKEKRCKRKVKMDEGNSRTNKVRELTKKMNSNFRDEMLITEPTKKRDEMVIPEPTKKILKLKSL